eukprot:811055-Rhodomonas_salina.1
MRWAGGKREFSFEERGDVFDQLGWVGCLVGVAVRESVTVLSEVFDVLDQPAGRGEEEVRRDEGDEGDDGKMGRWEEKDGRRRGDGEDGRMGGDEEVGRRRGGRKVRRRDVVIVIVVGVITGINTNANAK